MKGCDLRTRHPTPNGDSAGHSLHQHSLAARLSLSPWKGNVMYFEADLKIMHKSRHKSQRKKNGISCEQGICRNPCITVSHVEPVHLLGINNGSITRRLRFLQCPEPCGDPVFSAPFAGEETDVQTSGSAQRAQKPSPERTVSRRPHVNSR